MSQQNRYHAELDGFGLCDLCIKPDPYAVIKPVETTEDILYWLDHFRSMKQEYLICLSLDGGQQLIARRIVTIGLPDSVQSHPREVFADPLADRAASIVIAHNHPSGSATPSKRDIAMTQQIISAGKVLGIPVRDHIVITDKSHFSFMQHYLM